MGAKKQTKNIEKKKIGTQIRDVPFKNIKE
jgi:hypothetical protein